jgi:ABC-type Fe3+-siderophore transport system permease subunit
VIGWYWERVTAALLALASLGVVAAGVIYGFAPQVWAVVTFALIGPMMTASVLFWAAREEQEAYERATALRPDLAFAFSARSTIGR